MSKTDLISVEKIEKAIYFIRGEKVMLDRDLASLYDVSTGALNQAVRRNRDRFPEDFMFQLIASEVGELNLSQIVIGSEKHRDPRLRPYAFTEQGVAMLSSVLHSKRAITVNIELMRAFVKLRQLNRSQFVTGSRDPKPLTVRSYRAWNLLVFINPVIPNKSHSFGGCIKLSFNRPRPQSPYFARR